MQMKEATVRTIGVAMQAILPSLPILAVDFYASRRSEAARDGIRMGGLDDEIEAAGDGSSKLNAGTVGRGKGTR